MVEIDAFSRRTVGWLSQLSLQFGHWLRSPEPLLASRHLVNPELTGESLFILLPGIQDRHVDFEAAGFVTSAREQMVAADLLAVDAHIGYYARQTILERLHEDVVKPARAAHGYKRIWLVGTSLGGLGAALYANRYEEYVDGILLLAPFLGEAAMIREIEKAGGPMRWRPRTNDFRAELWRWLAQYFEEPNRKPNLFLGFGDRDRFSYAHGFLAEALSRDQVLTVPGSHDWPTWRRLWREFLERLEIERVP